jgi:anti-sigma factor RsiW
MNNWQSTISEEEIQAYVDGSLPNERRAEIDLLLAHNAALAARVSDYFSLNALLHERYDPVMSEPVPQRLRSMLVRQRFNAANWPRFAGMAAALVIGIAIGTGTQMGHTLATLSAGGNGEWRSASAGESDPFARRAAIAHVLYMTAVDRPARISTDQEEDFVRWLANKLGTDVHPPILSGLGFQLMGGRIVPGDDGQMALFMYRDAAGERVTLSVSRKKVPSNTTAFKLYQDGPVNVFYWVDGDFGYAISGGISRDTLLSLSHAVYAQLTRKAG